MTDRKTIRLHDIERTCPVDGATGEAKRGEPGDMESTRIPGAPWRELFAAVGGDKMLGDSKDR